MTITNHQHHKLKPRNADPACQEHNGRRRSYVTDQTLKSKVFSNNYGVNLTLELTRIYKFKYSQSTALKLGEKKTKEVLADEKAITGLLTDFSFACTGE